MTGSHAATHGTAPPQNEAATLARRYAAEFIGTALLVIAGVGTAVLTPDNDILPIATAFGLSLLVLAYALGPVSGCHINPAVTVGMTIVGRLSVRDAVGYVIAQIIGGIVGASIVLAVAAGRPSYSRSKNGLGANGWGAHSAENYNLLSAAIVEVLLSALLVYVVLAVTESTSTTIIAGVPIGFTLLLCHLVAIPIDGTSVNPARSIGPALFTGGAALGQLWLFILAPLLGAVIAALAYRGLRPPEEQETSDDSTAEPSG